MLRILCNQMCKTVIQRSYMLLKIVELDWVRGHFLSVLREIFVEYK